MKDRPELIRGLWDKPTSVETIERVKEFWRERYAPYDDMSSAFEATAPAHLYDEHGQALGVSWGVFRALGVDVALEMFDDDGTRV